jgi:hypothetical protein
MERQLTFIDVDENRLELWLKPDRVQLVVIDSRPELEAGELRRFASVLFAEYVARDLADRLAAARRGLLEARDRAWGGDPTAAASSGVSGGPAAPVAAIAPGGGELAAALDGALRAIDELAAAVAIPEPLPVPVEIDPEALEGEPAPLGFISGAGGPAGLAGLGEPEPRLEPILVQPAGDRRYPSLQASLQAARRAARKRSRGGDRAEEASAIRWGGRAIAAR